MKRPVCARFLEDWQMLLDAVAVLYRETRGEMELG